jgi:hypothetical protein
MPRPVTVTISHDLGKDEARRRLTEGFGKLKGALGGGMLFSFVEEWTGADQLSFTAKGLGQTIIGKIDVFPQHVRIEATLPNILASIAETVAGRVEKEGRLLLEKK